MGVSSGPGGSRRVQFTDHNGVRRAIQLGGRQSRNAAKLDRLVAKLVACHASGQPMDRETAAWVAELPPKTHDKLARWGLVAQRGAAAHVPATLLAFLDHYREERPSLKFNTVRNLKQTAARLVGLFGDAKRLDSFTAGDADRFRHHLEAKRLSPATISRELKRAKQFFQAAVRDRLLLENPFGDLKAGPQTNEARMFFVDRATTTKVLDACPDAEWRLIVALCRYGGLRCPSELKPLTWADVDWDRGRFTVTSPKTEAHAGKASRVVPIFPELLPFLRDAFDAAPEGATYVVPRCRQADVNLRTGLLRILSRASVNAWPKLFVNLRATCETELCEQYPAHVVVKWIGNSEAVARKHYLQVTDDHYRRAAGMPVGESHEAAKASPKKVTQKVTQHVTERARTDSHGTRQPREKRVFPGVGDRSSTPTGVRTSAVSLGIDVNSEAESLKKSLTFSPQALEQLAAALVALAAVPMSDATRSAAAREIAERLAD